MKENAQRDANTVCVLVVVRFGHRPPARPLQTRKHRQDRLQYTAQHHTISRDLITLHASAV